MEDVFDAMRMKYTVMPDNIDDVELCIKEAVQYMNTEKAPFGLFIQKGVFEKYKLQTDPCPDMHPLSREEAIKMVAGELSEADLCVSTTGMPSRELYEYRVSQYGVDGATGRDFMCVGNMGHCSSIALGLAHAQPAKQVVCIDGDGSTVMHMGALVTAGVKGVSNFKHVVLNNAAHDSVGGQPTYAYDFSIPDIASASGYKGTKTVSTPEEIQQGMQWLNSTEGPLLLEVRTKKGARSDLGRPKSTPIENKDMFMKYCMQ